MMVALTLLDELKGIGSQTGCACEGSLLGSMTDEIGG